MPSESTPEGFAFIMKESRNLVPVKRYTPMQDEQTTPQENEEEKKEEEATPETPAEPVPA